MLPKKERLSSADFPKNTRNTRVFRGTNLNLTMSKLLRNAGPAKFSFVVSSKVSKKAVERNKLRRRGYAAIGEIKDTIRKNHSYVFYFNKGAISLPYENLKEEIAFILRKIGAFF